MVFWVNALGSYLGIVERISKAIFTELVNKVEPVGWLVVYIVYCVSLWRCWVSTLSKVSNCDQCRHQLITSALNPLVKQALGTGAAFSPAHSIPLHAAHFPNIVAPLLLRKPQFISLHIRSMWETICDAWACWSGWNFGPNSTEYPYSEIQFQNTPLPPRKWKLSEILAVWLFSFRIPPPKWKLSEILALWLFSFRIPPLKMKIVRDLGTLTFQFQNTPPPPQKWKLSEYLALWLFNFRIPPLLKMKIVRDLGTLRLFSFRIPPPPRKWKLSEILALWLFSFRIPPLEMKIVRDLGTLTFQFQNTPPPENENCQRSWHFKTFQFQNPPWKWKLSEILALWLFSFRIPTPTMCGKLPHVETLSSPDNYSFNYCLCYKSRSAHTKCYWTVLLFCAFEPRVVFNKERSSRRGGILRFHLIYSVSHWQC